MSEWIPFRRCGFWDYPLNFLVNHDGRLFLFDRQFSEELDDYPNSYSVYLLPNNDVDPPLTEWADLPRKAICQLTDIPLASIRFDETRRKLIHSEVFDQLYPLPPIADQNPRAVERVTSL